MPGGNKNIRPEDGKKFSKEYQPPEKWTEKKAIELGNELIEWLTDEENEKNIFFEDFLYIKKKLYHQLISYLSKKFSTFSTLIEKAKKIQETKLKKYGVFDKLNATMTKFVLINNHDWKEKTESDIKLTGIEDITPLTFVKNDKDK